MKVKITLKFRGREMAHTEFGFQVVRKFLTEITPFGHPDFAPKLIGRGINVMISPLPRNKRAKNPHEAVKMEDEDAGESADTDEDEEDEDDDVSESEDSSETAESQGHQEKNSSEGKVADKSLNRIEADGAH
jgi:translation initiation factor IF-3